MDTKQLAAQLRQMDQDQATAAMQGCTTADLKAIAKELGMRLPAGYRKDQLVILIAKQVGYKALHQRIQSRPSTMDRMM